MSIAIPINDIIELLHANSKDVDEGLKQHLRATLGKEFVESVADLRILTMALDSLRFPSPVLVRFSESDIQFVSINGLNCPVDRHDFSVSIPSAHQGVYEPHVVACLRKICRPGSVAFDIGANVGYHTMLMAHLAGSEGMCYAFEPNSENCRLILIGKEHNHISNLTLMPIALSDEIGFAYFATSLGSNGAFVDQKYMAMHGHGTVVPTFTLDSLPLPKVDVMKIDVEGAEYKILKGAEKHLLNSRPSIICEFSMAMTQRVSGVSAETFFNWMLGMEYNIYMLDRSHGEIVLMNSVGDFFNRWGDVYRIEDFLFLPREKVHLIAVT